MELGFRAKVKGRVSQQGSYKTSEAVTSQYRVSFFPNIKVFADSWNQQTNVTSHFFFFFWSLWKKKETLLQLSDGKLN